MLLAYRYCNLPVVAVDRERRACFDSFVTAFRKFGVPGKNEVRLRARFDLHQCGRFAYDYSGRRGMSVERLFFELILAIGCGVPLEQKYILMYVQAQCLENLSFVTGNIEDTTPPKGTFFLSVHGCNEVSPLALEMARSCEGGFTVMPWYVWCDCREFPCASLFGMAGSRLLSMSSCLSVCLSVRMYATMHVAGFGKKSCIRDNLLGVQTKSGRGRWALGDDARYVKR